MAPVTELPIAQFEPSDVYDDDGRAKRTGTVWTTSAHIITAVIGSGVLSIAWAIAQLGWIAGPAVMILFAIVVYYTSTLLSECYRTGDSVTGKRNYTYTDAVRANLGGFKFKMCGFIQYLNLFGTSIGYTIAASISMLAVVKSNCYHSKGHDSACNFSSNPYMILFGVIQIFFSQIPDFDQISWLSIVAAIMSFTYSFIGLLLGILQTSENGRFQGSLTGVSIGTGVNGITETQKIWRSFQAFGDIAFAYSYSIILIEIQDTIRSPPSEVQTMKKGCKIGAVTTTLFYMVCGCMGYAAFGNDAPGNLLTGFGFYNPYWLIDIANIAITVHLIGAYQVFGQPLFAFVENHARRTWPDSNLVNREFRIKSTTIKLNPFRIAWRTSYVVLTTVLSMLLPFFNDVVGILGALGFWPLTVYFPVEMYIAQKKVPKWSTYWVSLQMLSVACLIVSIAAAAGSIAGVVLDLKVYRPF